MPLQTMSLLLAAITTSVIAQSTASVAERLGTMAGAGVAEGRAIGITAGVAKGKETVLLKAHGKSDVEADVPMTVDTIIPIGSVTKQFTAAAILQLRDQGKLGLDDPLTKWLPDFETQGNKVTIRHLLGHTSGIADLLVMPQLREMRFIRNPAVTLDDIYKVVKGYPFLFPTGTIQIYSNSNFWLLGRILEKASGMTYEDYVEKKMFEPLGMSRSMYCNPAETVPRRASGYFLKSGTPVRVPDIVHTGTYSAGAICSTAEDMLKWLQALHGGKVLPSKSYAEMMAPSKLADGTSTRYAMGTSVAEDRNGLRFMGHNGGGFGYSAEARWYPDAQLAIAVLTNSEPDAITVTTEDIAAAILPVSNPARPFTGDVSLLLGKYKGPGRRGEMIVDITRTPEGIAFAVEGGPGGALTWLEQRKFRYKGKDAVLTFHPAAKTAPANELRLDNGGDHFVLKRQ